MIDDPVTVEGLATPPRVHLAAAWRRLARFSRRQPAGLASLVFIVAIVLVAIMADAIAPYAPRETIAGARLRDPSFDHLFGTDEIGRDVFSRVVFGARVSLIVGLLATVTGVTGGAAIGIVSGYTGRAVDLVVQRVMDALLAFPALVFAMTIVSVTGPGVKGTVIAVGIVVVPTANRVARAETLAVRNREYVQAARAVGAGPLRIILQHILPNVFAPMVVIASIVFGAAVLIEASLSFLGLGVQPPDPSWGQMLSGSGRLFLTEHPILAIAPGMAISLTVLAFNLLGDTVRDVLDPRLRV